MGKIGIQIEIKDNSEEKECILSFDDFLEKYKTEAKKVTSKFKSFAKLFLNIICWMVTYIGINVGFSIALKFSNNLYIVSAILIGTIIILALIYILLYGIYKLCLEKYDNELSKEYVKILKNLLKDYSLSSNQKSIKFILKNLNDSSKLPLTPNTILTSGLSACFTYLFSDALKGIEFFSVDYVMLISQFCFSLFSLVVLIKLIYRFMDINKYKKILKKALEDYLWETTYYVDETEEILNVSPINNI